MNLFFYQATGQVTELGLSLAYDIVKEKSPRITTMFGQKKIPKPAKGKLTDAEVFIINALCDKMDEHHGELLRKQVAFFKSFVRLELKSSFVTELYPESLYAIPKEILFSRTEEFKAGRIILKINDLKIKCDFNMVLGSLFELSINSTLPPGKFDLTTAKTISSEIEQNLDHNMYG